MGAVCNTPKKKKPSSVNVAEITSVLSVASKTCSKRLILCSEELAVLIEKLKNMFSSSLTRRNFEEERGTLEKILRQEKLRLKLTKGADSSKYLLSVCIPTIEESKGDFSALQSLAVHLENILYAVNLMCCLKENPPEKLRKKFVSAIVKNFGVLAYEELKQYRDLVEIMRPEELTEYTASEREINDFISLFAKEHQYNLDEINKVGHKAGKLADHEQPSSGSAIEVHTNNIQLEIDAEKSGRKNNSLLHKDAGAQFGQKPSHFSQSNKQSEFNPEEEKKIPFESESKGRKIELTDNNHSKDPVILPRSLPQQEKKITKDQPLPSAILMKGILSNGTQNKSGYYDADIYENEQRETKNDEPVFKPVKANPNKPSFSSTLSMHEDHFESIIEFIMKPRSQFQDQKKSRRPEIQNIQPHDENLFELEPIDLDDNKTLDQMKDNHKLDLYQVSLNGNQGHLFDHPYATPESFQLYSEINTRLSKQGTKFIDEDFSKDALSTLCDDPSNFPYMDKIEWRRLSEVCPKSVIHPEITEIGRVEANFVVSPSYLTSATALSMNPSLIRPLIYPNELNSQGLFSITLWSSGEWKSLQIDDYVPFIKGTNRLAFSQNTDSSVWVPLLEKAVSKLLGSYQAQTLADDLVLLRMLVGVPCSTMSRVFQDSSLLWQLIEKLVSDNFTAYVKYNPKSTQEESKTFQIASPSSKIKRASLITDAKLQPGIDGEKIMMVQLKKIFDLEDASNKTADNIITDTPKELEHAYWIPFSEFCAKYNQLTFFRAINNPQYQSFELQYPVSLKTEPSNVTLVKIITKKSTQSIFSIRQKYDENNTNTNTSSYGLIRLIIGKLDPYGRVYDSVDGNFDAVQELNLEYEFEEGSYILLIECFWGEKQRKEALFSCYSSETLAISLLKPTKSTYDDYLEQFCAAYAVKQLNLDPQPDNFLIVEGYSRSIRRIITTKLKGLLIIYYRNSSEKEVIHQYFCVKNREDHSLLQCVPFSPDPLPEYEISVSVLPQSSHLIVFKSTSLNPVSFDASPQTMIEKIST